MSNDNGNSGLSRPIRFALSGLMLLSLIGCTPEPTKGSIDKTSIQSALKANKAIAVADILKMQEGTICVLYPYQTMVDSTVQDRDSINASLKEQGFLADEDRWSLIVTNGGIAHISTFSRSVDFDVLPQGEIPYLDRSLIPTGFSPKNCASIERAAITSVDLRNRTYLLLGEIK